MDEKLAVLRQQYVTPRDRAADARAIELIVNTAPSNPEVIEQPAKPGKSHPIQLIGLQEYALFRAQAEAVGHGDLPWDDIEHGFVQIGSGIVKCLLAYCQYKNQVGEDLSGQQLRSALLHPKTISFFVKIAGVSEIENREYETFFNLRGNYTVENHGELQYADEPEPHFQPKPELINEAEEEAASKRYELIKAGIDESELGTCPALKYIPHFARLIVDACDKAGLLELGSRGVLVDETDMGDTSPDE